MPGNFHDNARMTANWMGAPVREVLFDLDGTLLDTAGDIALALQRAFADHGQAGPQLEEVRCIIGRGAPMLIERACESRALGWSTTQREAVLERFFHHYGSLHSNHESVAKPYDGVHEALQTLHAQAIPMAVVTNKQHRFAVDLLAHLELDAYMRVVVGGDTCERRKPDPQPLQWACAQLGIPVDHSVMVGDSINDVQAARSAGMRVVCVPYGYNEGQDPRQLPCDQLVDSLSALPALWGVAA